MREIEFRIWDVKNKKMIRFEDECSDDMLMCPFTGALYDSAALLFRDEFKRMQYTGLKDKNGKKMYEGDIVLWPGWDGKTYQVCYDRWGIPALAGIKDAEGGDFKEFEMQYNATPAKCVVIGNIYENPEILK